MTSELTQRLIQLFRWSDPGPASPFLVSDLTGWWRDADLLAEIGPALAEPFRSARPTIVVAPEVTGLLLGPLVAVALGVGFVPAHKRLPPAAAPGSSDGAEWRADGAESRPIAEHRADVAHQTQAEQRADPELRADTELRAIAEPTSWVGTVPDHGGRRLLLGIRDRLVNPWDRVLVVDDWVRTGAQLRAVHQVVAARGAESVGTAALVADCPPEAARELGLIGLVSGHELDR